jgi:hypothetical protein
MELIKNEVRELISLNKLPGTDQEFFIDLIRYNGL